jgi:electron transfer flavoprotein alpha subunit
MANVWVYVELNEGKLQSTAGELLTRARELGDVTAIALGTGAKAAAASLGKHGAKVAYVNEDKVFDEFVAEPATDALEALHKQQPADLILFSFTSDSRDVAGRLAARLRCGREGWRLRRQGALLRWREDGLHARQRQARDRAHPPEIIRGE